jgi:sRNA-binding regulator protein Hfq
MGIDDATLVEKVGASLESLDHAQARDAIARLRRELEESGTWQPRVGEGPDQEGEYLAKLRDRHLPLEICLITGERFTGLVEDFTAYVIRLRRPSDGSEISVRKLAIAYYQTEGPVDDSE